MKIEVGKYYKTREGKKVRILCTDRKDDAYPVIGLLDENNTEASIVTYDSEGRYISDETYCLDLIEEWLDTLEEKGYIILNDSGEVVTFYLDSDEDELVRGHWNGYKIVRVLIKEIPEDTDK